MVFSTIQNRQHEHPRKARRVQTGGSNWGSLHCEVKRPHSYRIQDCDEQHSLARCASAAYQAECWLQDIKTREAVYPHRKSKRLNPAMQQHSSHRATTISSRPVELSNSCLLTCKLGEKIERACRSKMTMPVRSKTRASRRVLPSTTHEHPPQGSCRSNPQSLSVQQR